MRGQTLVILLINSVSIPIVNKVDIYSVSTNFRLELIESSASEIFIFWTHVEREERGGASEERRGEHGSNLARLEAAKQRSRKAIDTQPHLADDSISSSRK